ncbi:MAG: hypothetical protein ACJ75G_07690 [Gaiellaceae bacterium]
MKLSLILMLGTLVAVLTLGLVVAPVQAGVRYGGIGAFVWHFDAQNAHGSATPPVGAAYYRIDDSRAGRVAAYHVALNPQSKLSTAQLKRLVTGSELPTDAEHIKGHWNPAAGGGYCAIYKSRWLGRRLYGPYIVLHVSAGDQAASAYVSTAPACRG